MDTAPDKYLLNTLTLLSTLQREYSTIIDKPDTPLHGLSAKVRKNDKSGYTIKIEEPPRDFMSLKDIDAIGWSMGEQRVVSEAIYPHFTDGNSIEALVSHFTTSTSMKGESGFFRLVIPFDVRFSFIFQIARFSIVIHHTGGSISTTNCTRAFFSDTALDLYIVQPDHNLQSFFLVVDCHAKVAFSEFERMAFASIVSLGYMCGHFIQDNGYYFYYDNDLLSIPIDFKYQELRSSVRPGYTPINRNPHSIIRDRSIAQIEQHDLRTLTHSEFSLLCLQAYKSERFLAILLLIIESTAASQVMMPTGLTVALEGLTGLITEEFEEKISPIPDRTLARRLRADLKEVLQKHEHQITPSGYQTLQRKLDGINSPTNSDQLHRPFQIVGFALEDVDKAAIKHRNDFMHGRITLLELDDSGKEVSVHGESFRHVYHTALRLYCLVSVLILRRIGFTGKIINHPKVQEKILKQTLCEPFFRDINTIPCSKRF